MPEEIIGLKVQVTTDADRSVGSIRQQVRLATAELIAMRDKFGDLSPQAAAAAKKVAELKERIADAKEQADAFNPDAKFKALTQSLVGVTGGFAAMQGSMALFGGASKDLEKQLVKVQGAMALAQGLDQLLQAKDGFMNLASVIKDKVVGAFSTLKGAIIATGVGAFAVAIGLIITNWKEFSAWIDKAFPKLGGIANLFDNIKKVAMGSLNVIVEYFKQIGSMTLDLFTGHWGDLVDKAKNFGSTMAKSYAKGYNEEEAAQSKEKEAAQIESLQKQKEREIKLLEAQGKDTYLMRKKQLEDDLKLIEIRDGKEVEAYKDKLNDLDILKAKHALETNLAAHLKVIEKDRKDPITGLTIEEHKDIHAEIIAGMKARIVDEKDILRGAFETKKEINEAEKEDRLQTLEAIGNAGSAFAALAGEDTAAGKALAIVGATISTYFSAQKAFESQFKPIALVDSPIRATIAAAAAVAAGLANVKRIAGIQVPGRSGGSSMPSSSNPFSSAGAPINPMVQTTYINQSQINQLQSGLMRAYVLESDISQSQSRTKRIQQAAEFGGG